MNVLPPPTKYRVQLPRDLFWVATPWDDFGVFLAGSYVSYAPPGCDPTISPPIGRRDLLEEVGVRWCLLRGNHGKYRQGLYTEEWAALLVKALRYYPGGPRAVTEALRKGAADSGWRNCVLSHAALCGLGAGDPSEIQDWAALRDLLFWEPGGLASRLADM